MNEWRDAVDEATATITTTVIGEASEPVPRGNREAYWILNQVIAGGQLRIVTT